MQCVDEGPEEERDSLHGRRVSQPSRSCRLRGSQCHRGLSGIPGMVGEAFSVALEDQLSLNYSYGFHSVSIELIFYGFFVFFTIQQFFDKDRRTKISAQLAIRHDIIIAAMAIF